MRKNAARWPIRQYAVNNGQIEASCKQAGEISDHMMGNPNFQSCSVKAMVDWHVGNYQGRKVGGLTQVYYEIAIAADGTGNNRVFYQSENVINRQPE
jgi:hypothetical protein